MPKHIITIISITAFLTLCMLLPFLPGRYDGLAVTLSFMAQLFSFAGLLLVPLGLLWLWFELTKHNPTTPSHNKTKHFSIVTVFTLAFVTVVVSLGALTNYHLSFGLLFLAFCFFLLTRTFLKLKRGSIPHSSKSNHIPIYLITIPVFVALIRFGFILAVVQFSRDEGIKNSEPLITAIEAYHAKNGNYPISLQAIHTDILPGVVGIKQYHYEPNGTAYNLYFKQFSDELDVEEIVMYNKLDQHAFAAHVLDILEHSEDELALRRGDRHKYKLSAPHWMYIKFE